MEEGFWSVETNTSGQGWSQDERRLYDMLMIVHEMSGFRNEPKEHIRIYNISMIPLAQWFLQGPSFPREFCCLAHYCRTLYNLSPFCTFSESKPELDVLTPFTAASIKRATTAEKRYGRSNEQRSLHWIAVGVSSTNLTSWTNTISVSVSNIPQLESEVCSVMML